MFWDTFQTSLNPGQEQIEALRELQEYMNSINGAEFHQFCNRFPFQNFLDASLNSTDPEVSELCFICFGMSALSYKFANWEDGSCDMIPLILPFISRSRDCCKAVASVLSGLAGSTARNCIMIMRDYLQVIAELPECSELGSLIVVLCSIRHPKANPMIIDLIFKIQNCDECEESAFTAFYDCSRNNPELVTEDVLNKMWSRIERNYDRYFFQIGSEFVLAFANTLSLFHPLPLKFCADLIAKFQQIAQNKLEKAETRALVAISKLFLAHVDEWAVLCDEISTLAFSMIYILPNDEIRVKSIPYVIEIQLVMVANAFWRIENPNITIEQMIAMEIQFMESAELDKQCVSKLVYLGSVMSGNLCVREMLLNCVSQIEMLMERSSGDLVIVCESLLELIDGIQ
jgi:hypothetical protein